MGHLLSTLFGAGSWGVGGNILADALFLIPSVLAALWQHRRQIHARLDQIEARITGGSPTAAAAAEASSTRSAPETAPPLTSGDTEPVSRPKDELTGG